MQAALLASIDFFFLTIMCSTLLYRTLSKLIESGYVK